MFKKLARSFISATAVVAAAVALPTAANAAPAETTVTVGEEVWVRHADGGVGGHLDSHASSEGFTKCTLGFAFVGSDNEPRALIAGHCGDVHEELQSSNGTVVGRIADAANFTGTFDSPDTALVSFTPGVAVNSVLPGIAPVSGKLTLGDVERTSPVLCKLGVTTGLTCGPIDSKVRTPKSMIAFSAVGEQGDSGAPVWTYGANGEVLMIGTLVADGSLPGGPGKEAGVLYVEPVSGYMVKWKLH